MFKWSNFSGSLLVRSVYLITLPIVLVQVVGIIIFFELHWDLVLKRSAQSIANEIEILELNKDDEKIDKFANTLQIIKTCLLYTSPSPRDRQKSRMPSSA